MSVAACGIPECTVAATGVCLQNLAIDACPNRLSVGSRQSNAGESAVASPEEPEAQFSEEGEVYPSKLGDSVLDRPAEVPRLPRSDTLSLGHADRVRVERRATAVGVVGLPDSGKTACLASMYLLLAKGMLDGFTFVNSETLMAFEEIARGSRRWNEGNPPKQMTAHTELSDDREAGFLHLRLHRQARDEIVDLLIPDLPGEWSRSLIDQNDTDRFEFLKAVSVIWIMVDGRKFIDRSKVAYATYRAECLIERLAAFLPCPRPRVILVSSWRDEGEIPAGVVTKLQEEAQKWGIHLDAISVASFSDTEAIKPGSGISQLIEETLREPTIPRKFWPEAQIVQASRAILNFRGGA